MPLTQKQIEELNAAAAKTVKTAEDTANLNYAAQTYGYKIPDSVSSDDLTSSAVNIPSAQSSDTYPSVMSGYKTQLSSLQNKIDNLDKPTVEETEMSTKNTNLIEKLQEQLASLTGVKSKAYSEAAADTGINEMNRKLKEISEQAANLTAQYDTAINQISGTPGQTVRYVTGQQQKLAKQQAIEVGKLTAVASALQGNISLAQKNIDDVVSMEYEDSENEINSTLKLIELNKENMTAAEKKRADEQTRLLEEKKSLLEDQKAEKENIYNLAISAAKNGADTAALNSIMSSTSLQEAINNAGEYLSTSDASSLYTTDYKNWLLAGAESGTGKSYQDWLKVSSTTTEPKQYQYTAANYATRISQANDVFDTLDLSKFTTAKNVVSGSKFWPNWMKSSDRQSLEQAEKNFINAVLRRESGAVISDSEFENAAKQYFPQVGDTEETLKQKSANRALVEKNILTESGNAVSSTDKIKGIIRNNKTIKDSVDKMRNDGYSDDDIYQIISFNNVGGDTNKAVTINKAESVKDGTKGGQCGRFVNNITGLGLGDSYASKLSKMDKTIKYPQSGMVFVMPYKDTGHTGIILSVNNDGTATVKDSNYSLDGKVKTHKIPISKMTGFTYA